MLRLLINAYACSPGMGYSQYVVQQMLLRECLVTGNYERVFFLSGLCYPLLGKRDFDQFFEQHPDA